MQRHRQRFPDHPDWSDWTPRFYVNPANPWKGQEVMDTLAGRWYAPVGVVGTFLMVYPAESNAYGDPYYVYLEDLFASDFHSLAHGECRTLTALHAAGFRRVAPDALPPDVARVFSAEWQEFLDDLVAPSA
jgi:hypothetical protein